MPGGISGGLTSGGLTGDPNGGDPLGGVSPGVGGISPGFGAISPGIDGTSALGGVSPSPDATATGEASPETAAADEGPALASWDAATVAATADTEDVLTDLATGADELLSSAVQYAPSDPFSSAQGGWTLGAQVANNSGLSDVLASFVGQVVDWYTGAPPVDDNPNFYTGGQNIEPFSGAPVSTGPLSDYGGPDGSSTSAPAEGANGYADLTAAYQSALQTEQSQLLAANDRVYVPTSDGGYLVVPAPDVVVQDAPYYGGDSSTGVTVPGHMVGDQTSDYQSLLDNDELMQAIQDAHQNDLLMQAIQSAVQQPSSADEAPPTDSTPSPNPEAFQPPPQPFLSAQTPGVTPPPDWTTQTEWAFSVPDPRLIPAVTSFDSGNTPLNIVLNKVLLPIRNMLAATENIPIAAALDINDALSHAFPMEYQAAQVMLPLEGAMGLTMEAGPALDYATTWLSTRVGSGLAYAVGKLGSELGSLGPELETSPPAVGAPGAPPANNLAGEWYQIFRPIRQGETALNYGLAIHEEGPQRFMGQAFPNLQGLTYARGAPGIDVDASLAQVNAPGFELKPISTYEDFPGQKTLNFQRQAEFNWGYELPSLDYIFYDRETGMAVLGKITDPIE
jgi:hypothetical protein